MQHSLPAIPRIGIGVIITKNNLVLIGKRKNAHGQGCWAFPGGHLEFFEHIEACARREVAEETGLTVANVSFAALTNDFFEKEQKHYVTIFMKADYVTGTPEVKEPHKCETWQWVAWDDLPKPLFLTIQNLKEQGYAP